VATGRTPFESSPYEDSELLTVVSDVARQLKIEVPAKLTQVLFDAHRADAGHPLAPTAKRICARLRGSWDDVRRRAFDPTTDASVLAGRRRGSSERPCSLEEAAAALALVARRLGVSCVSKRVYVQERNAVLNADKKRWLHGGRVWLPTEGQMLFGRTWAEIETAAGLEHSSGKKITPPDVRTQNVLDLIELALETKGALPSKRDLEAFAAASGRQCPRYKMRHPEYIELLRKRRKESGLPTPDRMLAQAERPDFSVVPEEVVLVSLRNGVWSRDACVAAFVRALDEANGELTQRAYQALSVGRRDLPAAARFEQYGGFGVIRDEARALRRKRFTD
jgi:hypothetical protein